MSTLPVGPSLKTPLWSLQFVKEEIQKVADDFSCMATREDMLNPFEGDRFLERQAKTIEQEVILLFKLIAKTQAESPTNNSIVLSRSVDDQESIVAKLFSEALKIKAEFSSGKEKLVGRFTWEKGYDFQKVYSQFKEWEKKGWKLSSPRDHADSSKPWTHSQLLVEKGEGYPASDLNESQYLSLERLDEGENKLISAGNKRLKDEQYQEAYSLFQQADEYGSIKAKTDLAFFYLMGLGGVPQDKEKAVRLLTIAAKKGHARAQINLAKILVARNQMSQAKVWYLLAAGHDEGNAVDKVKLYKWDEEKTDLNELIRSTLHLTPISKSFGSKEK